jgi:hypothetical protein
MGRVVDLEIQWWGSVCAALYRVSGRLVPGDVDALIARTAETARRLELWDLREADLGAWDYHEARENLVNLRSCYDMGVRVATVVKSRAQFRVVWMVRTIAETERLNAEFGVFRKIAAATLWLSSEEPPTSAAVIDTVLPEAPTQGEDPSGG